MHEFAAAVRWLRWSAQLGWATVLPQPLTCPRAHTLMPSDRPKRVHIVGGGPAGLTAAYSLCKQGHVPVVFESGPIVGGIARTEQYRGYRFDIGGHRFFTQSEDIQKIWEELLGDQFLTVSRLSRIHYNGELFDYPLRIGNVLGNLGPAESALILLSYLRAAVFPSRVEENFEQWVSNRFGKRLYRAFFKSYTEKVWGIPCHEISAEWAAQRIQGLSFMTALRNALPGGHQNGVKSLIDQFHYPRLGPGMMWEAMRSWIADHGGEVHCHHEILTLRREGNRITSLVVGIQGATETVPVDELISSMPLATLIRRMEPAPPDVVVEAGRALRYRDFLTVCLVVDKRDVFPDNRIYIHDPDVRMGRLQNYKNWSVDMVADVNKTSLGAEYFVNVGDDLWEMEDSELVELAARELQGLNLVARERVEDGVVYRQRKAYPIYDDSYRDHVRQLAEHVESIENLQTVGRNGLHKYNNQDHSMHTAILAVENLFGGKHDVWAVNSDDRYHEAPAESG